EQGGEHLLAIVGGDERDAGLAGSLLGAQRRPAAGDGDACCRVGAMQRTQPFTRDTFGAYRHRAGVEDDDLGLLRRRHDDVTGVAQLAGKRLHFAVVEAAANLVEKDVHEQDSGYWANSSANDIWKPDKTPSPCTMSSSRNS